MQVLGQTTDGQTLVRLDDGRVLEFSSAMEAMMSVAKLGTAAAVVRCVQSLATATDTAAAMCQEYQDQQPALTDAELAVLGMTAADLSNCIALLENFDKFMNGQATDINAYRVTLNVVRRMAV